MFEQYDDWQRDRLGKITASECSKLMSKGRAKDKYFSEQGESYIMQKAAEILTCEPNNGGRANTDSMEWGNSHEQEAFEAWQKASGKTATYYGGGNPKFFSHSDFFGGSPDAIGSDFILEIKCPFNSAIHCEHLMLDSGEALKAEKPNYYWQIVANCYIHNLPRGVFVSYDPRFEIGRAHV